MTILYTFSLALAASPCQSKVVDQARWGASNFKSSLTRMCGLGPAPALRSADPGHE